MNLYFTIGGDFNSNNNLLLKILQTFSFTQEEPSLDMLVSYTIPSGWKKGNFLPTEKIQLRSPDFITDYEYGCPGLAVEIRRDFYLDGNLKTLRDKATKEKANGNFDIKDMSVGGINGIYFRNKIQYLAKYSQEYQVIKDGYLWTIGACADDISLQTKYDSEIKQIVNSIKFK